jgi:prophage antirepressor-like protein
MKLVPFKFDGTVVRVIDRDGEPWFVLADVCRVLEIENSRNAAARLDDDEKGVCSVDTLGGSQNATIISESGLYSLILTSRKEGARRFKKWVTAEVLPSIRKTGGYGHTQPDYALILNDPAALRGLLGNYAERVIKLEGQVEEMKPVVSAYDRIARSDGSLCITDAAKTLQVQPQELFRHLRAHGWIYRRAGGAADIAYQSKIISGLLEHKTTTVQRTDGTDKTATQVRITPKGLARLAEELTPKLAL